jgi:hypothetical protein
MTNYPIQYIKNVTAYASFNASLGQWTQQIQSLPADNPDECIIRSITYLGPANSVKTYLIWSSLNNDYIGSANVDAISTQAPGARIMLNNPVGNSVTFQLHQIVPSAVPGASITQAATDVAADGSIVIHMEFVKYKDTPSHA